MGQEAEEAPAIPHPGLGRCHLPPCRPGSSLSRRCFGEISDESNCMYREVPLPNPRRCIEFGSLLLACGCCKPEHGKRGFGHYENAAQHSVLFGIVEAAWTDRSRARFSQK